jgi:hypothetical protein
MEEEEWRRNKGGRALAQTLTTTTSGTGAHHLEQSSHADIDRVQNIRIRVNRSLAQQMKT